MTTMHNAALKDPLRLFQVSGKSAIITGATGAFGHASAIMLGALGAKLTLASGAKDELDAVAGEVRGAGGAVTTVNCRPNSLADAETIVRAAVDAYDGVDILIVASGMNKPAFIEAMSPEDWESVMDANVRGSWLMCKAAGTRMIEQGRGGKVVLLSSVRGRHGNYSGYSAYCTSKAAVEGLTRVLATEWGKRRITVNAIGPTVFRSKLTAWMYGDDPLGQQTRQRSLSRIPLGRLGETEDLMGILLYLVSPASDFCTGQVFYIDGGYTAG